MKKIEAKLRYKKHIWINYSNGSFNYNSCQVDYTFTYSNKNKEIEMNIIILTESVYEDICPVFIEIIDFMYLACGTMPIITFYRENNKDIELKKLSCRFFPSMKYFKNEHLIDITNQTLNDKTLLKVQNIIKNKPFDIFCAFTVLTKVYGEIYIEHSITLLLQCLEGYIYNKDKSYQIKGISFKYRIKEIVSVFFDYDKRYNSEILQTLNYSEDSYLIMLSDTRHQFSHYISKANALNKDKEYVVNLFILHYIFRLYLLKELGLILNEKNVEEFLKSTYDWINVLNNENFKEFKSISYLLQK